MAGDFLGPEHVVQGVVERPQIRVDLGLEVPGQEAESLARLHGRAGEDDAPDGPAGQRLDGRRHGQIGLPGSSRSDAEDQRVVPDGIDVRALANGLGADDLPPPDRDHLAEHAARGRHRLADHLDHSTHGVLFQRGTLLHEQEEFLDDGAGIVGGLWFAREQNLVAARDDGRLREGRFHGSEVTVLVAQQVDHQANTGNPDSIGGLGRQRQKAPSMRGVDEDNIRGSQVYRWSGCQEQQPVDRIGG